jgi:hypothetical protein
VAFSPKFFTNRKEWSDKIRAFPTSRKKPRDMGHPDLLLGKVLKNTSPEKVLKNMFPGGQ